MKTGTLARTITALGLLAMAFTAGEASAGLFRAYLSLNGNDTRPCNLAQPCRLLPAALDAVNDGGEIWMLDSANYNTTTATITKSVTILAVPGALGSLVANGADAVNINAPSAKVTFRNLVILNLSGSTNNGIAFTQGTGLTVEGCEIYGVNFGVYIGAPGSSTTISDTVIRDTTATGVQMSGSSELELRNVTLLNNYSGVVAASGPTVSIAGSTISGSAHFGISATASGTTTTQLSVSDSTITGNATGLNVVVGSSADTAQATISDVTFALNSTAVNLGGGASATASTRANNAFKFNTANVVGGSLTPPIAETDPCPMPTYPINATPFTDINSVEVAGYGAQGQGLVFRDQASTHQINVIELPKSGGVRVAAAALSFVGWNNYPQFIEAALSKCRGDFAYSLSPAAAINQFGQTFYPCHAYAEGGSGNQILYGPTGDYSRCQIPNDNSTWYINFRYVNAPSAGAGYGCPNGECASITSWGPQ